MEVPKGAQPFKPVAFVDETSIDQITAKEQRRTQRHAVRTALQVLAAASILNGEHQRIRWQLFGRS